MKVKDIKEVFIAEDTYGNRTAYLESDYSRMYENNTAINYKWNM